MIVFQEMPGHRIKITQPNLMILVSFSSAEDALSNDVKNIFLVLKVLKICRSAFIWPDTRVYYALSNNVKTKKTKKQKKT